MKRRLNFVFLFLICLICSCSAEEKRASELKFAPDFTLSDLSGKSVSLSDYKDKKTVVLFFWTTWCPYCRKELKTLNTEYPSLAEKSIEVLAIDIGESEERVKDFVESQKLSFRVFLDQDSLVADKYELMGVPSYIIVNKAGQAIHFANDFPRDELKKLSVK